MLSFGMSGCGEAPKPVVKQLDHVEPIVMQFPKLDAVTGKPYTLNLDLSSLTKLSRYGKYRLISRGKDSDIDTYGGIKIYKNGNIYYLSYENAEIFRSSPTQWIDKTIFEILEKKEGSTLTFYYPSSATYTDDGEIFGASMASIDTLDKDAKIIFAGIKNLSVHKVFKLEGTIDGKYSMDDVYSNFKRLMKGTYPTQEELTSAKKSNIFLMEQKDGTFFHIKIEVFNHRGGSKIHYQASLPYSISVNGSSLNKHDINSYRKRINDIIKD